MVSSSSYWSLFRGEKKRNKNVKTTLFFIRTVTYEISHDNRKFSARSQRQKMNTAGNTIDWLVLEISLINPNFGPNFSIGSILTTLTMVGLGWVKNKEIMTSTFVFTQHMLTQDRWKKTQHMIFPSLLECQSPEASFLLLCSMFVPFTILSSILQSFIIIVSLFVS